MEETALFARKRVVWERLVPYGFTREGDAYRFSKGILDGQLRLCVEVRADGCVDTHVVDAATGEGYVLHRVPGAVGAFAGSVRAAYAAAMADIAAACFETDVFKSAQARQVIAHVREVYGNELEYLWERFPDNAVWRRQDNGKWYAALLTVPRRKLGFDSDEVVEIIDLRAEPAQLGRLVDGRRFLPGWHMNKKNWYTIVLDESVPIDDILQGIDASFRIAARK